MSIKIEFKVINNLLFNYIVLPQPVKVTACEKKVDAYAIEN
jgi:hypothetical protein